jgi:hypothetical protein
LIKARRVAAKVAKLPELLHKLKHVEILAHYL